MFSWRVTSTCRVREALLAFMTGRAGKVISLGVAAETFSDRAGLVTGWVVFFEATGLGFFAGGGEGICLWPACGWERRLFGSGRGRRLE